MIEKTTEKDLKNLNNMEYGIFLTILFLLFIGIITSLMFMQQHIVNKNYSEIIQNQEIVRKMDYAIANNIDCSNDNATLVCLDIKKELNKNYKNKMTSSRLFKMYFYKKEGV